MKKNILFATSECVPFIKTGGLADVAGALPKAFNKDEFDVRVILPNYLCIPEKFRNEFEYLGHFYLGLGGKFADTHCGVMRYELDGITYYFIDNLFYFGGEKPYGDIRGDVEKFTFFSKAVLSVLKTIDFRPDLIHCHDWQTGFIPVYLKNQFADDPYYHNIKTVFTIHNLKFQGVWDIKTMKEISGFGDYLFTPDKLEYKRDANMLKGGLTYSDYITTVSETYAQEIQTEEYGEGMEGLLQARHFDMQGIVNGIDYDVYNPETDKNIFVNFNAENWREKKVENKLKLQEELGLTYLFIAHDLSVVKYISDVIGVMYLGNLVEYATKDELFDNPLHPYTKALLSAVPLPDPDAKMNRTILEGDLPSPANPPVGCKFNTRCPECMDICTKEQPALRILKNGHKIACHLYDGKEM